MDATIVWLIIALFYAPLHYLLPLLVVLMTGREEGEARRQRLVATAIDCTLSMIVAFVVVIWLAGERLQTAMFVRPKLEAMFKNNTDRGADLTSM